MNAYYVAVVVIPLGLALALPWAFPMTVRPLVGLIPWSFAFVGTLLGATILEGRDDRSGDHLRRWRRIAPWAVGVVLVLGLCASLLWAFVLGLNALGGTSGTP